MTVEQIQHEVDRLVGAGQVKVTDAGEGRVSIGDHGGSWALLRAELALEALSGIRGPLEVGEEGQDRSLVDVVCGLESIRAGSLYPWLREVGLLVEPHHGGVVVRVDGYTFGLPVITTTWCSDTEREAVEQHRRASEHVEIVRTTKTTYVDSNGLHFYRAAGRARVAGQQRGGLARILPFELSRLEVAR